MKSVAVISGVLLFLVYTPKILGAENTVAVEHAKSLEDLEKYGFNVSQINPKVAADAFLTTPELLKKYGYPSEVHVVQTADGYLLELHRIAKPGGIPVFLQHGIMDSSGGWIMMGPHKSLGYFLADLGYDVWMGNIRGNRYSRKHVTMSPKENAFWDFSFHEIGTYDVPASIDYVLRYTGFSKLHYIGHSQGTTVFWVMCSQKPDYCNKILSMQALAPIAYMEYVKSPLIRAVVPFLNQIEFLLKLLGVHEFMPNNDFFKLAGDMLCKEEAPTQEMCMNAIFLITGFNSEQVNRTMLPVVFGHIPAGSSAKQFIHYGQLIKSGKFRAHDYGVAKNILRYGSFKPPTYNLKKVTAPVALHYSRNDWLADLLDVQKLQKGLPNIIKEYLVPNPKFNHLDFLIAIDGREILHYEILNVMKKIEAKNNF